jgi:acyl-CoA dehydrogenase
MDKLDDQKRDGGSRDMETSWGFGIIVHRYTWNLWRRRTWFSFNALFIEELKKGISGPGFSLHSDIVAPYLLKYGTEAQKQKYLPQMAKGEMITAIGMTEPNCGSESTKNHCRR